MHSTDSARPVCAFCVTQHTSPSPLVCSQSAASSHVTASAPVFGQPAGGKHMNVGAIELSIRQQTSEPGWQYALPHLIPGLSLGMLVSGLLASSVCGALSGTGMLASCGGSTEASLAGTLASTFTGCAPASVSAFEPSLKRPVAAAPLHALTTAPAAIRNGATNAEIGEES